MINQPSGQLIWVDKPTLLERMVSDLARHKQLAVDTESNSLYAYKEQVCLIQFSTGTIDYLVDPLALDDLSLLGPIFADERIEKIFHAAEYDIICLKRDFNFAFRNLFDTMIAGRNLGRSALGLAAMLKDEYGITLDKQYQRANWGKRPLPAPMLAYARYDTHFLIPLRNQLNQELQVKGRWQLTQEDFARLAETMPTPSTNGAEQCWRIAGHQEISPTQLTVLYKLCEYRDRRARDANLPPFKILGNHVLLQIALNLPDTCEELLTIEGFSQRNLERHGDAILRVVAEGQQAKPITRPHNNNRPGETYLMRLDALRNWRKETGEAIGVASDVILPRDVLEMIAQANPGEIKELARVMQDLPWRLERFGKDILKVLKT